MIYTLSNNSDIDSSRIDVWKLVSNQTQLQMSYLYKGRLNAFTFDSSGIYIAGLNEIIKISHSGQTIWRKNYFLPNNQIPWGGEKIYLDYVKTASSIPTQAVVSIEANIYDSTTMGVSRKYVDVINRSDGSTYTGIAGHWRNGKTLRATLNSGKVVRIGVAVDNNNGIVINIEDVNITLMTYNPMSAIEIIAMEMINNKLYVLTIDPNQSYQLLSYDLSAYDNSNNINIGGTIITSINDIYCGMGTAYLRKNGQNLIISTASNIVRTLNTTTGLISTSNINNACIENGWKMVDGPLVNIFKSGAISIQNKKKIGVDQSMITIKENFFGSSALNLNPITNYGDSLVYIFTSHTMGTDKILLSAYTTNGSSITKSWLTIVQNNTNTSTSISDVSQNLIKINLYPNPATDIVNIDGLDKPTTVSIIDIHGKILKKEIVEKSINIESLSSGVYFVKVDGINQSFKIIKT